MATVPIAAPPEVVAAAIALFGGDNIALIRTGRSSGAFSTSLTA